MKKLKMIILSFFCVAIIGIVHVHAAALTILINGAVVTVPQETHVVNNQVILPVRWMAEQLGVRSVGWDGDTNTVLIQANETYSEYQKLLSYAQGLMLRDENKEKEIYPLPEKVKEISLPSLAGLRPMELVETWPGVQRVGISINDSPYAIYNAEVHNDHIYISSDWIETLFKAKMDYNGELNQLSIQTFSAEQLDKYIGDIENSLIAVSPEEALKLWGRGEQTRSGALQYAALSPELRKKAMERIDSSSFGWTTGGSSPWVGPISIKEEKKLSDTAVEYTISYPEITSAGSTTGSEKIEVEKLDINGRQGWYLTKFLMGNTYYSIIPPETEVSQDDAKGVTYVPANNQNDTKVAGIDQAVGLAVKAQSSKYGPGEVATEGHIILDTEEEQDGKVKAYTIASYGAYGFENGIFTLVSGSGAIPTVMIFSKDEKGEYSLLAYQEPMDGEGNLESKKKMFPQRLWDQVLSEQKYYPELKGQKEEQARQYLKSIGRNAEVSEAYVKRELPQINVEASNKLFAVFTKGDPELNNFPYWLGTRELLTDGGRYIYETSQSKTDDGYDLIYFKKTKEDGTIVKEYRYKIVGSEPQLLE